MVAATKISAVTHHRWNDMPWQRVTDVIARRVICGERMMIAHVYLKKGSIVPRHSHDNEQLTYILEGALRFHIRADGEEIIVRAGEVLVIPSKRAAPGRGTSRTPSMSTCSPRRARTGSTAPTTTFIASDRRARAAIAAQSLP